MGCDVGDINNDGLFDFSAGNLPCWIGVDISRCAFPVARSCSPHCCGYASIERTWKAGDTIEVVLPMNVQRVKTIDAVDANRGRVALRRGPLIYSIESADGNNMDAVLEPDAELTTEWRPELLGGVMVIKSTFADGSPLVAIPNYARNNRVRNSGEVGGFGRPRGNPRGQSTVWIRDK
jgi:hypothetical protein